MIQAFPDITDDTAARVYLRPLGIISGAETKRAGRFADAHPLAGGEAVFERCELIVRQGGRIASVGARVSEIDDWAAGR
ncbi:MAG: hypothetical protein IIC57_08560, partial [Proteobacteria bacterium]|nr:hypothetical protein [Pseudomonadota bacterium]